MVGQSDLPHLVNKEPKKIITQVHRHEREKDRQTETFSERERQRKTERERELPLTYINIYTHLYCQVTLLSFHFSFVSRKLAHFGGLVFFAQK